jgi:hypothetical protein
MTRAGSGIRNLDIIQVGASYTGLLITALSRIRWFFVIARNSCFIYNGKSADIRNVAHARGRCFPPSGVQVPASLGRSKHAKRP